MQKKTPLILPPFTTNQNPQPYIIKHPFMIKHHLILSHTPLYLSLSMANKVLLSLFLSLLVVAAVGRRQFPQLSESQQCRFQRISASQPQQRLEHEGGVTELWDEFEDQFQCAGVAPIRNILRPNSLSLPNFHPAPRLVYIEQGQGLLGVNMPGCAETFSSHQTEQEEEQQQGQSRRGREQRGSSRRDQHQRVHRVRQGDIVALPAGATHWCFNDGNEELVAVSITDLTNPANQLDQKFRAFYLAGSPPKRGQQQSEQVSDSFQNIFQAFDEELMAEAFAVPTEVVRSMQQQDEKRGLIVNVREGMKVIRPDEEEEEEYERRGGRGSNGLEETFCSTKLHMNLDDSRQADVFSKQAGRLNIANQHKLPILRFLDLSAEKGNLYPNALLSPHWSTHGHSIVYVTRGEAQVQVIGHNGQALFNDRVSQGNMFVVPQFYAATARAGSNGFEWVAFKTTGSPMKSPLVGYTSVFRAMPLQVITNSYQCSPSEAQDLKMNRGGQSLLLSPLRGSSF